VHRQINRLINYNYLFVLIKNWYFKIVIH
jgi:hypothetical protein